MSRRCRAKRWTGTLARSGLWNATDGRAGVVVHVVLTCRAGHREEWDLYR